MWGTYGVLLLLVLWIASDRAGAALDRGAERLRDIVMRPSHLMFVALVSASTTLFAIVVSLYCYSGRGFTGDELAMGFHARMLLSGHIAVPAPTHPEFFNAVSVVMRDGRWYSQYPIGGPALLALGFALHAAWVINPLLLGFGAWQLHRFSTRAFGEATARLAMLLFALTPFVIVLGATQMNHTPALAFTLLALAELAAWDAMSGRWRLVHAAGIGLAVGCIALARPLDGVLVTIAIAVFEVHRVWLDRSRVPSVLVQIAAGAVPIAVLLAANAATTGQPLLFAYDAAHGASHAWGFHLDPYGELHSPRRGLVYASGYLMRLNRFLFEWPLPALLIVCVSLIRIRRATRWDALLLGLLGAFLLGYAGYWHDGFFDGPRFLFPVAPVLVLYAARLPLESASSQDDRRRRFVRWVVPACLLCSSLVPLPFSSVPGRVAAQRGQRTKLKTDVAAQASKAGLTNALVFVREPWRGRLLARLRGIGVRQFDAERIVDTTDACALQMALDAGVPREMDSIGHRAIIERAASAGPAARRVGGPAEAVVARAANAPDSPRCQEESAADTLGTMPYAMFLREQRVGSDGRLAGDVVWARDLGTRDSLLRGEYGARRWYVYRPGRSLDDEASFLPLR